MKKYRFIFLNYGNRCFNILYTFLLSDVKAQPVKSRTDRYLRISSDVAAQRLALLREQMNFYDIDAYIITTSDVHQVGGCLIIIRNRKFMLINVVIYLYNFNFRLNAINQNHYR